MHIAIIGSGSAAFAAAIYAAEEGNQVTIIERNILGGTCVNVGCVPSKILIRAAHVVHNQQSHPFKGIEKNIPSIQRKLLAFQQQHRVDELRQAKYETILTSMPNISFVKGIASFLNKNTLQIKTESGDIKRIQADRILIATGSSPSTPSIPGLKDTPFWTSTEALLSEELPKHLIVIGGSVVAVELAQAFRRLGSKVTLLARSTLLSKEDPQIGICLKKVFQEEGMKVLLNSVPDSIHYNSQFSVRLGNESIVGDRLLVATGRSANVEDLSLNKVGVNLNTRGQIIVNDHMQTNVDMIFAAGDCTNQPQYVYVAAAAGTRAAMNMLGKNISIDLTIVPSVTFTDPQIATVGLTEAQAKSQGILAEARLLTLDNVPRALANFDTRGFIQIVAEKKSGRILGAQIVAAEGGELIQTMTISIKKRMTVKELAGQLFPYLTMGEGLKLCAQIFSKDVKKLSCCADTGVIDEPKLDETITIEQLAHSQQQIMLLLQSMQQQINRITHSASPPRSPRIGLLTSERKPSNHDENCCSSAKTSPR